jgi:hypothetical protein
MASLSNDPGGRRRILFIDPDGNRKAIRLGKISKRQAESVKLRIEDLAGAKISGSTPSDETCRWLASIDDDLRDKLAAVGLAESRESATLGKFVQNYIEKRGETIKPGTMQVWRLTQKNLRGFFGDAKRLRDISPGDAEDFRNHLLSSGLGEATTRKRCAVSSQMLRYAMKHRSCPAIRLKMYRRLTWRPAITPLSIMTLRYR